MSSFSLDLNRRERYSSCGAIPVTNNQISINIIIFVSIMLSLMWLSPLLSTLCDNTVKRLNKLLTDFRVLIEVWRCFTDYMHFQFAASYTQKCNWSCCWGCNRTHHMYFSGSGGWKYACVQDLTADSSNGWGPSFPWVFLVVIFLSTSIIPTS